MDRGYGAVEWADGIVIVDGKLTIRREVASSIYGAGASGRRRGLADAGFRRWFGHRLPVALDVGPDPWGVSSHWRAELI